MVQLWATFEFGPARCKGSLTILGMTSMGGRIMVNGVVAMAIAEVDELGSEGVSSV